MNYLNTRLFCQLICLFAIGSAHLACSLNADDQWVRFRGPNGTGISDSTEVPVKIEESNLKWKLDLRGSGSSSPVVFDGQALVTSYESGNGGSGVLNLHWIDVNRGKRIRTKEIPVKPTRVHKRNSLASSTPAVGAEGIYLAVCDRDGAKLLAMDLSGQPRWSRDLGTFPSQHGFGASPIVFEDKVILFYSQQAERMRRGQQPGTSRMMAFSQKDGETLWETDLNATRTCYAVPAIVKQADGTDQIVSCNTGNGFFGIDAKSGTLKWSMAPFKMRTVASLLWTGDRLIGSCGSGGGGNYLVALKPSAGDSKTPFETAYRIDKANYVPSPIAVDDRLFLFTDKGIGRCLRLDDGEVVWEKRLASGFSGSPVSANKHLYVVDESGNLLVVNASDQPKIVAKYSLGESSRATPAIVNDQLLVRTERTLFCFAK